MIHTTDVDLHTLRVELPSRLDIQCSPNLKELFQIALRNDKKYFLVIADDVSYIDSSGLASIISGLKGARSHQGELYLVGPSPAVRELLSMTLLDRVIPTLEREADFSL
ncbi:MAG: STAS domain-containing protein [Deinococcaceae bacterium]